MSSHRNAYDCIIVPGGGSQRGPSCRTLPLWVRRRLDLALHLAAASGRATGVMPRIVLLSAGTPHRPNYVAPQSGFPILESTSAAEYLRSFGVVADGHFAAISTSASAAGPGGFITVSDLRRSWQEVASVLLASEAGASPNLPSGTPPTTALAKAWDRCLWRETTSLDTIGNAYFTRTGFLDPAVLGVVPLGGAETDLAKVRAHSPKVHEGPFRRIAVITSEFHMPRTRAVFDWALECIPALATASAAPPTFTLEDAFAVDGSSHAPSAPADAGAAVSAFHCELYGSSTSLLTAVADRATAAGRSAGMSPVDIEILEAARELVAAQSGTGAHVTRLDYWAVGDLSAVNASAGGRTTNSPSVMPLVALEARRAREAASLQAFAAGVATRISPTRYTERALLAAVRVCAARATRMGLHPDIGALESNVVACTSRAAAASPLPHASFLAALQRFVLCDHTAYSVHGTMTPQTAPQLDAADSY